jgi:hypothetical protein
MSPMDEDPLDTHSVEVDTLMEIARRLKVWATEVERPASYILDSLGENLQRCATRLFIVGTDLAISKMLAEEQAQRTKALLLVQSLPVWIGPWYLQDLARLAELAEFFPAPYLLGGLIDYNG